MNAKQKTKQLIEGTLKPTKENIEFVQGRYCEVICWNQVFKSAGLSGLPDPTGEFDESKYTAWMINNHRHIFNSKADAIKCLRKVKKMTLESIQ